jgi:TonB family protein
MKPSIRFFFNRSSIKIPLMVMITLCCAFTTRSQVEDFDRTSLMEFEMPDEPASYPGGIEAFYQFIKENMIYPLSARKDNIQGKLFVSFVVGTDGLIEPSTIRIAKSLTISCDGEALRVIKQSSTKWMPAKKNGKAMRQLFTLPIEFKLDDLYQRHGDFETVKPMKTAVIVSAEKKSDFGWNIYSDIKIEEKIDRALPGDSVEVVGWAPFLYLINFKSSLGYIYYKALKVTSEMKSLSEKLTRESSTWQSEIDRADSLRIKKLEQTWLPLINRFRMDKSQQKKLIEKDSLELVGNPMTFLQFTSTAKSLSVGECAVVDLSFYVNERNQIRLQFYELGKQLAEIHLKGLRKDHCWVASNNVSDIVSVIKKIGQQKYFVYNIYTASYCPFKAIPLNFESMKLDMAQMKVGNSKEVEKMITYATKPLSIKVNGLPENTAVTTSDLFKFTGDFALADTISAEKVQTGESATYKLSIQGRGLTFPLLPPKLSEDGFSSTLIDESNADTIIHNTYYSRKIFTFSILFTKSGRYDFSKKITYSFFNPKTKRVTRLIGKSKIDVIQSGLVLGKTRLPSLKKSSMVIMDVSQSMLVEDYSPNRLVAVEQGLIKFFERSANCDIGLIVFGGSAKVIEIEKDKFCYSEPLIRSLDQGLVEKGTAIGDAIWLALHSFNQNNSSEKKIVLIGDGDNTSGFLTPTAVIEMALKYRVSIYTIGVGTSGLAQYGVDYFGRPQMVDNTFSDKDFKKISLATGGRYYWAKDSGSITSILKEIF